MNWDRLRAPRVVDLAVAASFVLGQQLEVWIWWVPSEQGPKPLAAAMGLLATLPLLWRRRAPLAALAASLAVITIWNLVDVPQGSLWPLLTTLALVYAVAVHETARRASAGAAVAAAVWGLFVAVTTNSAADYGFIEAFIVAAWLVGRAVGSRQERADTLQARTRELEQEREEKVKEAAAAERARIARELHDIVSHSVSVMVVQAGAAEQVLDRDPEHARASLLTIQETGRQARAELRRLLGLMRDHDRDDVAALAPQPGLAELDALVEQLRQAGLDVGIAVEGEPRPLSRGLDLSAYRVIQEALTNTLAHGRAARAEVVVRYQRDALELEVVDDGTATTNGADAGYGLVGMQERVSLYGGRMEHGRRDGGGYRLLARLPVGGGDE
jgi:signal transduction histidine kinase